MIDTMSAGTFGSTASFSISVRDAAYLPTSLPESRLSLSLDESGGNFASCAASAVTSVILCSYLCGHGQSNSSIGFNASVAFWSPGQVASEHFLPSAYGTFSSDMACNRSYHMDLSTNFSWGVASLLSDEIFDLPDCQSSMFQDLFSVRWSGFLQPKVSEETTFRWNAAGNSSL